MDIKTMGCWIVLAAAPCAAAAATGDTGALPQFDATVLTGERVTEQKLLGQPTVLIVTPSKEAAEETRAWAKALRGRVDLDQVRVRDVLAIDLPFFMSESDALSRARARIPKQYHDMTWLTSEQTLESALDIPPSSEAPTVLVLGPQGQVLSRMSGGATQARIEQVMKGIEEAKKSGN